jgi:hypothetical protein
LENVEKFLCVIVPSLQKFLVGGRIKKNVSELSADAADIGVYHDVDQRHWEVLFLRRIEILFSTQL